ncbi:DUF5993 family protein [Francisella philomiragia]|uniref:DUF5993 family protein n=1 Tax=Francisella philomiragia TaxID=28110 RepID=UPI003512D93C
MPGILISFILLFISVMSAWSSRRLGIITFCLFLIVTSLVFLHHASDHLSIYL